MTSSILKRISLFPALLLLLPSLWAQKSILTLTQPSLMHEVRATPYPLDGAAATVNPPRLLWPDKFPHLGPVLDGEEEAEHKPAVIYRVRLSRDPEFRRDVTTAERAWAFYNPFRLLEAGIWYWQHAYVDPLGGEEWSPRYSFTISEDTPVFNPPAWSEVRTRVPNHHPRILLDKNDWEEIIRRNTDNPEAKGYIQKADKCLNLPVLHLREEIDTTQVVQLTNQVQYKATLIRESRKIVDREEARIETMIRAYLLTRDTKYYREAMKRLTEVLSWRDNKYFAGDFNLSTLLSMSTSAYDAFQDLLTSEEHDLLQGTLKDLGSFFFDEYVNHLENRIADNHVWQMTYRILTMSAFVTLGELPEAEIWADYCYNMWVARFPGLNKDGAWHNGDSYFQVNYRTLIEVPAFYSRLSGFHFFDDPWYKKNVNYVIYHQPPFSKSAGHGNAHENRKTPSGARVGYADALARECNDPWAAAYVRYIMERESDILNSAFEAKPADLTWYRCTTHKQLPADNRSLDELPGAKVFPYTGVATMHTRLGDPARNAMLSFRSSPYGSTSHALANQNAFNTFYSGQEIFYSSGHRTGFTDDHCMYSYRNTRAHNTLLADGMGQKIGTEGYGWIPRHYEGQQISYFVGDASNAYGQVTSPLWLHRARLSGTQFTPENGWDENKVKLFRRHVVRLGNTGLFVIYDELEGLAPVRWGYQLHTIRHPMEVDQQTDYVRVTGRNDRGGVSVAHLFSSVSVQTEQMDTFFCAPDNWKNVTDQSGRTLRYPNHWHFTATTSPAQSARFLTVIDTRGTDRSDMVIHRENDTFYMGDWQIECDLSDSGKSVLRISNELENILLEYDTTQSEGHTRITEKINGKSQVTELEDQLPEVVI